MSLPYQITKQSLALGINAGGGVKNNSQGLNAIAIGNEAGFDNQNIYCIALGEKAGHQNQGNNSLAIGKQAGETDQSANTIILNATGNPLNSDSSNAIYIAPVRGTTSLEGSKLMFYDTTTKEITYTNDGSIDLSCGLINDVSGINFCDGTFIGQGNSFDISTSEVLKVNQDALVVDTSNNIGIGTIVPTCSLDVSRTDAIKLPSGTTNERPANAVGGMIRYNTGTGNLEFYNDISGINNWVSINQKLLAIGGNTTEITDIDDGLQYRVHTFTGIGDHNFTVISGGGDVEYLIVAGGGGGGGNESFQHDRASGGGGAGGLIEGTFSIDVDTYPITVGDGGSGENDNRGSNGENSVAFDLTAFGGGGGGGKFNNAASGAEQNGGDGGSGGGAGRQATSGGLGTAGQGNDGGNGSQDDAGNGGGGAGGAGGAGVDGNPGQAGDGGIGLERKITGENKFYAGGGGGGGADEVDYKANDGVGGQGGGGDAGQDGDANTGGGGGAGGRSINGFDDVNAGAGGSGIVIIRYRI